MPYAVRGDNWLSYESLESLEIKLNFVISKHLGGSMVWAVDGDDVLNVCGDGKFAMMKEQMRILNKSK